MKVSSNMNANELKLIKHQIKLTRNNCDPYDNIISEYDRKKANSKKVKLGQVR